MQSDYNLASSPLTNYRFAQKLPSQAPQFGEDSFTNKGINWWIEVITSEPYCVYYFGPFTNMREAVANYDGYIQDLKDEGMKEPKISAVFKRCHPQNLTIFDE